MKGLIFTEFLEMVEDKFGYDVVDQILDASDLESNGIYTAVGTYHHSELLQMVTHLSTLSKIDVPDLVKAFAGHIFGYFTQHHGGFFENMTTFDFLESIDSHIHVEVRKLYPDAELPSFASERKGDSLTMTYQSSRPFADLAEGLIEAAINHFQEPLSFSRQDLSADGTHSQFHITSA